MLVAYALVIIQTFILNNAYKKITLFVVYYMPVNTACAMTSPPYYRLSASPNFLLNKQ